MKRLLIVVDCQKDFIDGALGFEGADKIIPGIVERIAEYKAAGDEVVYTMDTHTPDYMNTQEGRNLPVIHCVKGSEGYKLDKALEEPLSDCKGFDKPTFGSMDLANYIASNASEYSSIECWQRLRHPRLRSSLIQSLRLLLTPSSTRLRSMFWAEYR